MSFFFAFSIGIVTTLLVEFILLLALYLKEWDKWDRKNE